MSKTEKGSLTNLSDKKTKQATTILSRVKVSFNVRHTLYVSLTENEGQTETDRTRKAKINSKN